MKRLYERSLPIIIGGAVLFGSVIGLFLVAVVIVTAVYFF